MEQRDSLMGEINLFWMYPDILNLHGDRGNIQAFEKVASKLGLKVNVTRINMYGEEIALEDADILFFSPGELKSVPYIIEDLKRYEENLRQFVEEEKAVIAIGTTGSVFAKQITRTNGTIFSGLDFLDMEVKERTSVVGDDIWFPIGEGKEVVGSQIQMVDVILQTANPLERILYGYGNNGNRYEGARHKNLIFTNALGPVFVKNPWWAEDILRSICDKKGIFLEEKQIEYEIEQLSAKSIKCFIKQKMALIKK